MSTAREWIARDELIATVNRLAAKARPYWFAAVRQLVDLDLPVRKGELRLTRRQLVRWTRAGIIPRARQRALGRGRGTVSEYPSHAVIDVLFAVGIRPAFRKLTGLTWALWCVGVPVTEVVRTNLLAALDVSMRKRQRAYNRFRRNAERFPLTEADILGDAGRSLGFTIKRRVGAIQAETAYRMLLESQLAVPLQNRESTDDEDYAILARALSDRQLLHMRRPSRSELPGIGRAAVAVLEKLNLPAVRVGLKAAPTQWLTRIRDEAQGLYRQIAFATALCPPDFFLAYFAQRWILSSPQDSDPFQVADDDWPKPVPSMLEELVREAREKPAATTRKNNRRKTR